MNFPHWFWSHKSIMLLSLVLVLALMTNSSPPAAMAAVYSPVSPGTEMTSFLPQRQSTEIGTGSGSPPILNPDSTSRLFLPSVIRSSVSPEPTPTPSSSSAYWGALVNLSYPSTENMQPGGVYDSFETMAKKKMAILHWGESWKRGGVYEPFDTVYFANVRNHGSIPMLSWGSRDSYGGVNQPDFQLSDIYNGMHDSHIQNWAQSAKAWGHPFFLRFDWEMNGNWQFPWAEQINGNQPGDYVKAWRHVHDIFTRVGATNATWVWCPNIADPKTTPFSSLYPGDAYVDWTCLDGYNKYNVWLPFNTVFTGSGIDWLLNSYSQILAVAPNKPLMIGETASLEAGDGGAAKAAWIKDAYTTQMQTNFPRIKAILWFNSDDGNPAYTTLPIQSSSASINAFVTAIGAKFYATNSFSNLNTSPIPPPP